MATINVTEERISELNHIYTEGLKPGKYNFPDFLIIGPQRTGTTWLHRNLISNSNIFLPHNKELYFSMMIRNPVDRAWSHAKLGSLKKNCKASEEINLKELKVFYTSDYMMRCGKYTTIIQNWEK